MDDTTDRTLRALGLGEAPREHPLLYPGAWPADSGLLDGDRFLPPERLVYEERTPVIAIGSNGCPGQLRHKMTEFGIRSPLPMVKARVTGGAARGPAPGGPRACGGAGPPAPPPPPAVDPHP